MIIQCEACKTKYNFDEKKTEGDGFWVRCTKCENVFFQKTPPPDMAPPLADFMGPDEEDHEKGFDDLSEVIDEIGTGDKEVREVVMEDISIPEEKEEKQKKARKEKIPRKTKRVRWSPVALIAYIIVFILVVAGVYLWLFPDLGIKVLERISALPVLERIVGPAGEGRGVDLQKSAIGITDVEETYIENWVTGKLLVVEGIAANNNDYSVSKVRIRGRVLDESGGSIGEVESYCGNIIGDEELSNLTEVEIRQELSNPFGKAFPNKDIPAGGKIPFMLVFTNLANGANELSVELAGVEKEKW